MENEQVKKHGDVNFGLERKCKTFLKFWHSTIKQQQQTNTDLSKWRVLNPMTNETTA